MITAELVADYSPLKWCSKTLQDLADLLPRFIEVAEDLQRFDKALGNGELLWKPPKD